MKEISQKDEQAHDQPRPDDGSDAIPDQEKLINCEDEPKMIRALIHGHGGRGDS